MLIPAVENAISGDAFRPLDIYRSRKGITVEIGNTDAEGRLILADALALADEEKPELIVDMATLTGAARVALGPELPPFYTDDDALAADLARHARGRERSAVAHAAVAALRASCSIPRSPTSTTCRRQLRRLDHRRAVPAPLRHAAKAWVHFDVYAWTQNAEAGTAGRRRMPGRARALCAADRALRLTRCRSTYDPRITPARPDLAAKHLEGKVAAARFVEGEQREVIDAQAPVRRAPRPTRS